MYPLLIRKPGGCGSHSLRRIIVPRTKVKAAIYKTYVFLTNTGAAIWFRSSWFEMRTNLPFKRAVTTGAFLFVLSGVFIAQSWAMQQADGAHQTAAPKKARAVGAVKSVSGNV